MDNTPDFVYGGTDGTITTFAIVAGAAGANLDPSIILVLGLTKVIADGFSLAASRYLSAKTEEDVLGQPRIPSPLSSAISTFLSFVLMGMVPLISFVYGYFMHRNGNEMYPYAYFFTFLSLVFIGYIRGRYTQTNTMHNITQTVIIGGMTALIAYFVAKKISGL